MSTGTIAIKSLVPERLPDFLQFFDDFAFTDNPKWGSCYCQCFLEDHSVVRWSERTAAQNRELACSRIGGGLMQGYLAYDGAEPVGWCNAGPRRLFHALDEVPEQDAEHIGTIICFLVAPTHRGKGIARALLDAACEGLARQGLRIAEANPRPAARSAAENHFGPLALYLSAGFTVHRQDTDGSLYVRKPL
jgi:GNAT superfamily N-acetyltransferase